MTRACDDLAFVSVSTRFIWVSFGGSSAFRIRAAVSHYGVPVRRLVQFQRFYFSFTYLSATRDGVKNTVINKIPYRLVFLEVRNRLKYTVSVHVIESEHLTPRALLYFYEN